MRKTAIYVLMVAIVLSISSIAKAEVASIDFDGTLKSNKPSEFSLESLPASCATPKPSPAFITESGQENSAGKLRTLTDSARKSIISALETMPLGTINQEDIALLKTEAATIVFSSKLVYFATPRGEAGDYEIIGKTGNIQLLRAFNEFQDSPENAALTANKNWIIVCRNVIDWVVRIEAGREILVKVVTKVCEPEWATGGGEGGHIAPGSENHVRNNQPARNI